MDNNLQDKLNILKLGYLKKLQTIIPEFEGFAQNLNFVNIEEIYKKVHTISGTSGMYGLNELSEVSNDFEIYLKNIINDNSLYFETEYKEFLCKYINEIERTIKE